MPVAELQNAVASVAPGVPIYSVSSMQAKISSRLQESHFDTFLLSLFAATALVLASVGVYGVLSYVVAQRTHEIGIRIALGATQQNVLRQVLLQGMRLVSAGIAHRHSGGATECALACQPTFPGSRYGCDHLSSGLVAARGGSVTG